VLYNTNIHWSSLTASAARVPDASEKWVGSMVLDGSKMLKSGRASKNNEPVILTAFSSNISSSINDDN